MFVACHVLSLHPITVSLETGPVVAACAVGKREVEGVFGSCDRGAPALRRELGKQLCWGGQTGPEEICCSAAFLGFLSAAAAS